MDTSQLDQLPRGIQESIARVMGQVSVAVPNALAPLTPVDTGHLKQSWKGRHSNTQAQVFNTAFYAGFVESGTKRMKARPMITPMIDPVVQEIQRAILTGTDFSIPGGAFSDPATQLKSAYKKKYGNYGSQRGYRG